MILREDWEKAWQWGNKKHDYCHAFNESNTYMCSDSIKLPKKVDCRRYLKDIELCSWTDFDTMFSELKLYQVIQFNDKSWEMSTCTCWYWLKYYRCSHILVLATIMPMKNNPTNTYVDMEEDIFKKMMLTANRTLGRPKKNKGALSHQPNELQENDCGGIIWDNDVIEEIVDDNDVTDNDEIVDVVQNTKKRKNKEPVNNILITSNRLKNKKVHI